MSGCWIVFHEGTKIEAADAATGAVRVIAEEGDDPAQRDGGGTAGRLGEQRRDGGVVLAARLPP